MNGEAGEAFALQGQGDTGKKQGLTCLQNQGDIKMTSRRRCRKHDWLNSADDPTCITPCFSFNFGK